MNHFNDKISRRHLLKLGAVGAGAFAVGNIPGISYAAPFKAKAKSIIQIWMWGGPSHLDTFDPKPEAGSDYHGPLDKPIETNISGIRICQLMPELAKLADKYSIIRSMTHGVNGHETASYLTQTGREPGRLVHPSVGAVVSRFKGYDAGYKGIAPPYVVLTKPQGRFSESGFLGQKYKPFSTGGDPNQSVFAVEGLVAKGVTDARQKKRRELLNSLDTLGNVMEGNSEFAKADQSQAEAYEMMFGKGRQLFDLNNENEELRDRYGRNTFGQSCLMARRLVEAGVPYVTINYNGWDSHKQHFETMNRKLPEMDKAMAALLQDLNSRGLLDSTIIWWSGEFGRTPKILWNAPWNGGRGHFGNCFNALVAGGGFKGGHVVGESDDKGTSVKDRPVYPKDLIASMYSLMGIDPYGQLPNPRGIDVAVLPKDGKSGGILKEIM